MTEGRTFKIFVRNAKEEYVTTVALDSKRGTHGDRAKAQVLSSTLPSKWVIADYTRDADVLATKVGAVGAFTLFSVEDEKKLKSFRGYLAGRKKAGVVKLPGEGTLYLLPLADKACDRGESILLLWRRAGGSGESRPPLLAFRPPPEVRSESGSGGKGGKGGGDPGRDAEGGAGAGAGGGGFLGSLMGTLNQTHNSVAGTAAVDRANRAQEDAIRRKVDRFRREVREKLEAFANDPSTISHAFPPVEKGLRSIQHGLVEDFDGITSRTEGDAEDRHVVVYRLGYEPPLEEAEVDPQVHVGVARRSGSASRAGLAPVPAAIGRSGGRRGEDDDALVADALVRIGTVVKDRRTVEDIEHDTREAKRRKAAAHGGTGAT